MRVALGQLDMVWEDREASIEKAREILTTKGYTVYLKS